MNATVVLVAVFVTASFAQQPTTARNGSSAEDVNPLPGPNVTWFDPSQYLPRGDGVKLGRAISTPDPEYAESARQKRITGTVLLAVAINAEGTVDLVKVVTPLEPGLDQNAIEALRKWKFTPATKDGKAVPIQIPVSMSFRLY